MMRLCLTADAQDRRSCLRRVPELQALCSRTKLRTQNDNELLTRVGRGTRMGELMRRYWLPALLTEEIPAPDCAPVRVRLPGEDLLAFRELDGKGRLARRLRCGNSGCFSAGAAFVIPSEIEGRAAMGAMPKAEIRSILFTMSSSTIFRSCARSRWFGRLRTGTRSYEE